MTRPKYKVLWEEFFSKYGISLIHGWSVDREVPAKIEDTNSELKGGGRIDLLLRDTQNIVVIENKVKSDINKIDTDKPDEDQLDRYRDYVKWCLDKKEFGEQTQSFFFILAPNYQNHIVSNKEIKGYIIITYKELYDFLDRSRSLWKDDINMCDFHKAMKRHTYKNVNDYLYYEMQEKFYRRIFKL